MPSSARHLVCQGSAGGSLQARAHGGLWVRLLHVRHRTPHGSTGVYSSVWVAVWTTVTGADSVHWYVEEDRGHQGLEVGLDSTHNPA